jgi:hypothetical protein
VRERFWRDASLRSPLQPVIADRCGGVQAFFDVARIELDTACREPSRLGRFVTPYTGVTVSLQLDAN